MRRRARLRLPDRACLEVGAATSYTPTLNPQVVDGLGWVIGALVDPPVDDTAEPDAFRCAA